MLSGLRAPNTGFYMNRLASKMTINLPCLYRIRAMLSGLRVPNTGFYVNRLASVSTLVREWNALHAVGKVNFKEILFLAKPKPSPSPQTTLKTPQVGDRPESLMICCPTAVHNLYLILPGCTRLPSPLDLHVTDDLEAAGNACRERQRCSSIGRC